MKTNILISTGALAATLLTGCATSYDVESSSITRALDLDKADRFALNVVDTSDIDTAFSNNAQKFTSAELIDDLEDNGLTYVGERDPEIRFQFRTYATTQPSYLDPSPTGEIEITTVETRDTPSGQVTTTKTVTTMDPKVIGERIYLAADSRVFMLEAFDDKSDVLLWRGYMSIDDTGITEETLVQVLEDLTDRLEAET